MTAGWETKTLGETCEVLDKLRKPITKKDRIAGSVPYYGATGIVDYVEGFLFDEMLVLVGEDGAKWNAGDNTAFEISGKTWVNNHAHVLRPLRDEMLDQWLIYFLNFSDLSEYITGVTVPKLNQKKLRSIPIPLPPLEEQKRIVAVLDATFEGLDRARAHTEANLQNARDLSVSYLQKEFELLTAKAKNEIFLPELCISLHQGLNTAAEKVKFQDTGFPIIQTRNIDRGEIDLTNKIKYMSASDWGKYRDKYNPKKGDVFFTNIGTIGKTAVLSADSDYLIHWNIFKISPDLDTLDPDFLKLRLDFLTSAGFFQKKQKGGTVSFVTKKMMQQVSLPVISLETQKEFVSQALRALTEIRGVEHLYVSKLADIDDLRQSLLQKAFAGELT